MRLRWIILGGTLLFAIPRTRKIILDFFGGLMENKKIEESRGEA